MIWPHLKVMWLRKYDSIVQSKRCKKTIGRQKKKRKDNINGWVEMDFAGTTSAIERQDKVKKDFCKIKCGAPTTL